MIQETISGFTDSIVKGSCSQGLKVGDFIYISGQLPINPENGKIAKDVYTQTLQCLDNMQAILKNAGLDLRYVLKTTVMLKNINDFGEMERAYRERFCEPFPTRICCEVSGLLNGALVEIDGFAIDTRALEVLCSEECCECCGNDE